MNLIKGRRYTATATGTNSGERLFRQATFVAARDQVVEPFIRNVNAPDQDRVFVQYDGFGSVPRLYVTGSIKELA